MLDNLNPEQIMLAGDTHGNYQHWKRHLVPAADAFDTQVICQLGDFGYWEHTGDGEFHLKILDELLAKNDLYCFWLDGNHENHVLLREKYGEGDGGAVRIRDRIWWLPRGTRWRWQDTTFAACGGAYSIDKNWRRPGTSWWPEEDITRDDIEKTCEGGLVDVLLTHDNPMGIDMALHFALKWGGGYLKDIPESDASRHRVREIVNRTRPRIMFHGHHHIRYSDTILHPDAHVTYVEGLGCDGMAGDSWTILPLTERDDVDRT